LALEDQRRWNLPRAMNGGDGVWNIRIYVDGGDPFTTH